MSLLSSKTVTTTRKSNNQKAKELDLWLQFDECFQKETPLDCLYVKERAFGNRELCDVCNSLLCFSDEGFLTCSNLRCGIIYKDLVDHTAEWRYYGAEDNQSTDPTRCGMPINPLLQESSFGCRIISSGSISYEMRKIKRYTEWQSMPYKEKSQYDEFQRITIMCQNAGVPKLIIDYAIRLHKKISEYELTYRGENRDGILAASIYMSCKINNYPRTSREIAQIFNLDVASATKGCKNVQLIMNRLEKDLTSEEKTVLCKTKPDSFVDRYCSKLNMNTEQKTLCHFICKKIEDNELLPENTPHSIASGVMFFVGDLYKLNITKKDVKMVSDISEVTINKCYKKISNLKDKLVPPSILKRESA
jgi:transcription initiation factor TFIIB